MTRLDYELVADAIYQAGHENEAAVALAARYAIATRLANAFALRNPNFDKARFMRACRLPNLDQQSPKGGHT